MSRRSSATSFATGNTHLLDDEDMDHIADWLGRENLLEEELNEHLGEYEQINDSRQSRLLAYARLKYENQVLGTHGEVHLCVRPEDLEVNHARGVELAMTKLNEGYQGNAPEEVKNTLSRSLTSRYNVLKRVNTQHNRHAVMAASDEYTRVMEENVTKEPCMTLDMTTAHHQTARNSAFDLFRSKRYPYVEYSEDSYRSELENTISLEFNDFKAKNKTNNKNAIQKSMSKYDGLMRAECGPNEKCRHPDDIPRIHNRAKTQVLADFNDARPASCATANDEYKNQLNNELEERYKEFKNNNNLKNDSLVMKHFDRFVEKTKEFGKTTFVLGFIPHISKPGPRDFQKLQDEQIDLFHRDRRDGCRHSSDDYRSRLENMMERHSCQEIAFWWS